MQNWDVATIVFSALTGLALSACILVQVLLSCGVIPRSVLMIERIEGHPSWSWTPSPGKSGDSGKPDVRAGAAVEAGGILLKLSALDNGLECAEPTLTVLVNGKPVADFKYGSAAVVIHRGDLLEVEVNNADEDRIDSTAGGAHVEQLEIEVEDVTPNVTKPQKGDKCSIGPGRTQICNVIII
ncbi:MAG: hypothetical protein WBL79_05305 [Bacillota bacterium]|nr:hypothetical protein [Bacillota bacterium]HOB42206.1 hypothetical protein [Bacillota bacterium]HOL50745.1 hypothetical protein [Bacillota bacterium]HOO30456.1 hypothetical protein [Bacillota bacterium]HPZ13131.1 hypothetical protein [Bacillota bacterium]